MVLAFFLSFWDGTLERGRASKEEEEEEEADSPLCEMPQACLFRGG